MEVATRLFAKRGFNAATTAAIAEAAGVTEPILYRHFKSKQDLFIAIVRRMSEQMIAEWRSLIAEVDDPAECVRILGTQFPAEVHRLRHAYQVLHGAMATTHDKKVLAVLREHYRAAHSFFADIVREGQKRGQFRADLDASTPAWQFIYTAIGYAMTAINLAPFDDVEVEKLIDSILRGLQP